MLKEDFKLSDYFEEVFPKDNEIFTPRSVINIEQDHKEGHYLVMNKHPAIISQCYSLNDLEIKYSINEAIDKVKKLLKDKDPKNYRFLPVNKWQGIQTFHTMINNFPIRVVMSYAPSYGCFIITLDLIGNDSSLL